MDRPRRLAWFWRSLVISACEPAVARGSRAGLYPVEPSSDGEWRMLGSRPGLYAVFSAGSGQRGKCGPSRGRLDVETRQFGPRPEFLWRHPCRSMQSTACCHFHGGHAAQLPWPSSLKQARRCGPTGRSRTKNAGLRAPATQFGPRRFLLDRRARATIASSCHPGIHLVAMDADTGISALLRFRQ